MRSKARSLSESPTERTDAARDSCATTARHLGHVFRWRSRLDPEKKQPATWRQQHLDAFDPRRRPAPRSLGRLRPVALRWRWRLAFWAIFGDMAEFGGLAVGGWRLAVWRLDGWRWRLGGLAICEFAICDLRLAIGDWRLVDWRLAFGGLAIGGWRFADLRFCDLRWRFCDWLWRLAFWRLAIGDWRIGDLADCDCDFWRFGDWRLGRWRCVGDWRLAIG